MKWNYIYSDSLQEERPLNIIRHSAILIIQILVSNLWVCCELVWSQVSFFPPPSHLGLLLPPPPPYDEPVGGTPSRTNRINKLHLPSAPKQVNRQSQHQFPFEFCMSKMFTEYWHRHGPHSYGPYNLVRQSDNIKHKTCTHTEKHVKKNNYKSTEC